MIGKKCLKSLLMFGGIMSVLAFGKTALADEVPVIKGMMESMILAVLCRRRRDRIG